MSPVDIRIASVVGSELCLASDDGEKVHAAIVKAIREGNKVRLSFKGVEDLTSAFLNAAVGQLYGEFSESYLKDAMLPPTDASQEDLELLKRVVDRARDFFRDPEKHRRIMKEILGEDDG